MSAGKKLTMSKSNVLLKWTVLLCYWRLDGVISERTVFLGKKLTMSECSCGDCVDCLSVVTVLMWYCGDSVDVVLTLMWRMDCLNTGVTGFASERVSATVLTMLE